MADYLRFVMYIIILPLAAFLTGCTCKFEATGSKSDLLKRYDEIHAEKR